MWDLIAITLLIMILLMRAWKILSWIWVNPKKKERTLKQQGFKGNSYSLRNLLFGEVKKNSTVNAKALSKAISIHDDIVPRAIPFVHETVKKHGTKSFMWVGTRPRMLVLDPDQMKTIMNEYNSFIKNFKVANSIVKLLVGGLINLEGNEWSKSRGSFNPLFYFEKLKQMVPAFQVSCDEIMDEWKNFVFKDGSCEVDVVHYLESYTSKVLSKALFTTDHAKDKRIYELLKETSILTTQTSQILDFPGAKYLPTRANRRAKQIMSELRTLFAERIDEKAKAIKEGQTKGDNFFDVLLKFEVAQAHGIKNMDDIFGQLKLFYFAGFETSSMMLVWTMILLSIHPHWQERAREEVFQIFGDRKVDYEGISQLKVVSMIFNEVMRLYPSVVELSRLVEKETKLGDNIIPADTLLMLPIMMVHRNPEYWGEDVNEFKPDRFAEGVLKATKGKTAYFPFGWGPRVCIGQNFALLEGKVMMANILRTFSFELSPTYAHAPHVVFTLQPQYGAPIILHKLHARS
ncbi:Cytochrome [Abeliophyllum distichum]|uniref:Cytochrome n=1 Tax=Abeliophyllum distichum TaxID=126358 RepID=A0ABD1Q7U4_9LAMI